MFLIANKTKFTTVNFAWRATLYVHIFSSLGPTPLSIPPLVDASEHNNHTMSSHRSPPSLHDSRQVYLANLYRVAESKYDDEVISIVNHSLPVAATAAVVVLLFLLAATAGNNDWIFSLPVRIHTLSTNLYRLCRQLRFAAPTNERDIR